MRSVAGFLFVPLMALVLVLPAASPFFQAQRAFATNIVVGDANCDGTITASDPAAALRIMAGLDAGCATGVVDVNCSGSLDPGDVVLMLRHAAGLPESAPAGCPAIGSSYEPTGPSSSERIEQALREGTITRGQALLYHLYSELDDSHLPLQYRGPADASLPGESTVFQEAASAWNTLSQPEKDALRPFLLPPADPDSWVSERTAAGLAAATQWETVSNSRIKVWWQSSRPEDAAKASAILEELDSSIWPDIVTYMDNRAPLSDAGQQGSGGDGRYDVYLVHNEPNEPDEKPVLGWVSPSLDAQGNTKCKVTPTYMVLNSRVPLTPEFFSTVAHEFMHSVQFTYDVGSCDDYRWMMESTAVWVESWLYPEVNGEHAFAPSYLAQLDKQPLEYWKYKDPRQYGSYLFWYHAEHNDGLHFAVRDAWNASTNPDSLVAVDTAVAGAGGLKDVWPESALFNWNREPYEDFTTDDQLPAAASWNDTEVKATNAPTSYPVPTDVGHLQQRHLNFSIDASVKRLTFINSFAGNYDPDARIQALLNIDGEWLPQAVDWTDKDRVSFCFDRPNEKVRQLVIIITNSSFADRTHVLDAGPGELVATANGCNGWTGSVTAVIPHYDTTFKITVDHLRFAPDEENPGNERYDFYDLVDAGNATWTVSGMWFEGCTPSGTMTLKPPKTDPNAITGYFHVDKLNNTYDVLVAGNTYEDTLTITCPNGDTWDTGWPVSSILSDGAIFRPIPDDGVISEEYSEPLPAYGGTWTWNLTRVE